MEQKKKFRQNRLLLACLLLLTMGLAACGSTNEAEDSKSSTSNSPTIEVNPIVTITMEDDSKIEIELYPKKAPNTVNNFVTLVEKGYYDGLTFHRVIPDFMIQGGDPAGNGTGGPGYAINGEFSDNGFDNDLKHERGVISMARSGDPDSAGSQFFIMTKTTESLDGQYAAFGKVISGMEVVDKIVAVDRDANDKPKEDVIMKKVSVDTKGVNFPEPQKVE
ncbi:MULTISPECIES: peptidylprolyl isomerase [Bacillaceae]|uniref:peptidylprolyl isomerase n=1 Tax=Bacillaceae TaxID=186817 RepID=UPI001E415869|nr:MULTISPECIES: peptidylprolyl isomerase [Bacillaceae]MCE4047794.1 peptidylprolyl isomerase [Bacillus sp. Au-Bac7]MCM3031239.1 peptidylprolyl isomerase [Niallia sp. MER 6]MDL0434817.1 peptidylprolyl isomerase [Niallia sp. SS-2023]UPO89361.1 peptidylprolyl isomerase [Niallia sp. Man26]